MVEEKDDGKAEGKGNHWKTLCHFKISERERKAIQNLFAKFHQFSVKISGTRPLFQNYREISPQVRDVVDSIFDTKMMSREMADLEIAKIIQ